MAGQPMDRRQRTLQSLDGLSVGDAFGERFSVHSMQAMGERTLPPSPWQWTDDTAMAISVVAVLLEQGTIDQDDLARRFGEQYAADPGRGYGGGAQRLLRAVSQGEPWRQLAPTVFPGGSWGNGGAMRAAPIGAYFAGDPQRAADEARLSAEITHAHLEGQAGAMTVAVATALLAADDPPGGADLLASILPHVPFTRTTDGIARATKIPAQAWKEAASALGTGQRVAAFDTVPWCLWVAAHYSHDFEEALWITAGGLGDSDTTCAIVGGMVAARTPAPDSWIERREPLPPGE